MQVITITQKSTKANFEKIKILDAEHVYQKFEISDVASNDRNNIIADDFNKSEESDRHAYNC